MVETLLGPKLFSRCLIFEVRYRAEQRDSKEMSGAEPNFKEPAKQVVMFASPANLFATVERREA